MKKDFMTDQLGMYVNPEGNNVILGDVSYTDLTSRYVPNNIIYTAADGTTGYMTPGQDNKRISSNTVLEMNYQLGAQVNPDPQIMQVVSAYCSIVSPNDGSCGQKVLKKLQENPEAMSKQIRTTLEEAAAQEQQQQQQQMGAEEEEDMAKMGGCIDCEEAFPQAQNLNWFYKKAQMGRQVQTAMQDATSTDLPIELKMAQQWLAPQLGGKDYNNALNNMLVSGLVDRGWGLGSSDINRAKKMYKSVYGKDMDDDTMKAMVYRKSKEVGTPLNWATGIPIRAPYDQYLDFLFNPPKPTLTGKLEGGEAFPQANRYPTSWAGYNGEQYADGGEAFPQAQTYLPYDRPGETRFNGMAEYGGQTMDQIYQMMKRGGLNYDPKKKKGKQESFEEYQMRMGGLPKHQGVNQSQVGPPTEFTDFSQRVQPVYAPEQEDYEGPDFSLNEPMDAGVFADAPGRIGRQERRLQRKMERQNRRTNRQMGINSSATPFAMQTPKVPDEGPGYDQTAGVNDGFPTVTVNKQGSITPSTQAGTPTSYLPSYLNTSAQKASQTGSPGLYGYNQPHTGTLPDAIPYRYEPEYDQKSWQNNASQNQQPGASFGPTGTYAQNKQNALAQGLMPDYGKEGRAYAAGVGAPSILGRKGAALAGLFGAFGAGIDTLRGPKSRFSFKEAKGAPRQRLRGEAADIAASQYFSRFIPQGMMQRSQDGGQNNTQMSDFRYTFTNPYDYNTEPAEFLSGISAGLTLEDQKDRLEQARNRTAITNSPMGPITATKTQPGLGSAGPQGAVNARGMLPDTGPASRSMGAFPQMPLMYPQVPTSQFGGNIMDYLSEGVYDLPEDMDENQIQQLVNAIYAAGGSVEFM